MQTTSFSVKSIEELKNILEKTLQNGLRPSICVAFCGPDFNIEEAILAFQAHNIQLVGCTTAGEIYNFGVAENSFTALLMDMSEDSFKVVYAQGSGNDYSGPGAHISKTAKEIFTNPAILVYSGGIGVDGESIVKGIKSELDKEIPIYGGLGADQFRFERVCTFTHEGVYENGLSALIIDTDKIEVKGKTFSGWDDLGKTHTITKAEGNVLLEVDERPALDLFNNYFKGIEYKQQEGSEKLFTIPGIYALKIQRDDGTEFMRSTLIFDFEQKALVLAGGVQVGDTFKFCPTPSFDVVDTTVGEFNKLMEESGDAEALIMNSCAARHYAFGPMFEDEVEGIYNIWKAPMVGYMAYGEIGNTGIDQVCKFHNVTCSLVSLKEK